MVISVPSHPKYLCVVRAVAVKMGLLNGIDDAVTEQIKLAVDEACSNVIKHCYKGEPDKKITVKFGIVRAGFEVIIEDSGPKVDPKFIRGRSLDDIRPGGLGVHFIRRTFDIVEYDEKKKKGNRLRLVRHLRESPGYKDNVA